MDLQVQAYKKRGQGHSMIAVTELHGGQEAEEGLQTSLTEVIQMGW